MRRFSLIGAAGYIGSRQIQAIRDIGNGLDIAAIGPAHGSNTPFESETD